jgi:superfamily II DNA or RNA helicase
MEKPFSNATDTLIGRISAALATLTPEGRQAALRMSNYMLTPLSFSAKDRALVSEPVHERCATQLMLTEADPPQLAASCSCWESGGTRVCRHIRGLLLALLTELRKPQPIEAVTQWRQLAEAPTPEALLIRLDKLVARHVTVPRVADHWIGWRLKDLGDDIFVSAVVRSLLKSGRPGKGRAVSPQARYDLDQFGQNEQDKAVAAALESATPRVNASSFGFYSGAYRPPAGLRDLPTMNLLALLAGHPDVEWDDGVHVQIEEQPAGMVVVEHEGAYEIRLALGDTQIDGETVALLKEEGAAALSTDRTRLAVGLWGPRVGSLAKELLGSKIRVPVALGAALVQKLAPLRKKIPFVLPESLSARVVEPDSRAILVCEPQQPAGALVRVAVRPLAGTPLQAPGTGEKELFAFVGDEQLSTTRQFGAETNAAKALLEGLPLPATEEEPWVHRLGSDEEVLDLVTALKDPRWVDLQVQWPARPQLLSQAVRTLRVQIVANTDWFGVDGKTEIDGVTIELAEMMAAVRSGQRYVSLGQGKFVELERAFKERLAQLGDVVHGGRRGLELSPIAAPLADQVFDGFEVIAPLAWTKLIDRVKKARTTIPKLPKELDATLRDYQLDGYRWLWRLAQMGVGGCLADDMGLGKTVQTIAMLLERAKQGPQLVIAPTSVGFNWQNELARFAPSLRVVNFREADRGAAVDQAGPGDVVIVSYGLLRFSLEHLQKITWNTLVLDEAQAFKNYETHTARAVRSLKADWKIALSGTPLENHLGELYSLMHTVCPGLLGSWDHFSKIFARPIEKQQSAPRRDALARLLRPFILRRTKGQVLKELPSRTEVRLDATLSKQERTLYEATRLATLAALANRDEKKDPRFVIFAALTRMRQIASHARMVEPSAPKVSAKQALLMEHLSEVLSEGHTALVFSQFTTQLRIIEEDMHHRGMKTLYLDGSTPAKERKRLVEAFQGGEAPVFLVSLKAGGTGLNLTAADYVFLMDPWWNPAVEDQAADRAHRIGQKRAVTIVRLVATGTVEEKVLALHAHKRQLVAGVLDGADIAGKLSTDELVDLLREGQAGPADEEPKRKRSEAGSQTSA